MSDYNNFEEEDENDPTSRARVGPNPQLVDTANYTVIYNYVSPKPKVSKVILVVVIIIILK